MLQGNVAKWIYKTEEVVKAIINKCQVSSGCCEQKFWKLVNVLRSYCNVM